MSTDTADAATVDRDTATGTAARIENPPGQDVRGFLEYMGPAWIFTSAQIGGGEALSVPVIAAALGMEAIWLIPLVGFTKIFGQYYLVSQGVVSGETFQARLAEKPWWLRWIFWYVVIGGVFYAMGISGHLATTAGAWEFMLPGSTTVWMVIITLLSFGLVIIRRYDIIEKTATVFLWVFLAMVTIVALLLFPGPEEWITGLTTFPGQVDALGGGGIYIVAVSFGWIGAGFAPTTTYVWYAKDRGMGMFGALNDGHEVDLDDLTPEETKRLQGWNTVVLWQNIVASIVLVVFSMLLWVASAQTLYEQGIRPSGFGAVTEMAGIFTGTFGSWSGNLLLIAVSLALFTSMFAPAYGVSRIWEDSFGYIGGFEKFDIDRTLFYRVAVVVFLLIPLVLNLVIGAPLILFSVGGILFAPIIGLLYLVAIYLFFTDMPESLKPTRWWALILAVFAAVSALLSSFLSI